MWMIFWSTIFLACIGTLFLRIAGRKSISQMTIPQIIILLSIGTVLGTQVSGKGMKETILALAVFIGFLILVEWITLRSNVMESILKGKSVSVIREGKLDTNNLHKLRISVDDLEKRLRMAGISRVEDVKSGTIENNGELGYELYPEAAPVTRKDLQRMFEAYFPHPETEPLSGESGLQAKLHVEEKPRQFQ